MQKYFSNQTLKDILHVNYFTKNILYENILYLYFHERNVLWDILANIEFLNYV